MKPWETYLAERRDAALADMVDFLRIPSISSLKEHLPDVEEAAEWTANRLRRAGIENVRVMPTAGHPVVYGDWLHAPGKPVVLIYGHFDVQPADPLKLWANPPFEPTVRDGRVYARGAGDDKGNMLIPILVAEAFLKTESKLPVNLKFIFEGQEEIGSPQFVPFVAEHKDLLAAGLVISADGGQQSEDQPVLLVGLKGLVAMQVDVFGANTDLHSGVHGGAVTNPIHALVRILDSLRAPDGKITVPGFFDDVVDLTDEDRRQIAAVPFDEQKYFADLGVSDGFGEPGFTARERAWARPTLEINGIWGGFQGEGVKTVLPNEAHAKITCRLVANQDPGRAYKAIEAQVMPRRRRADAGGAGAGDPSAGAGLSLPDACGSSCQPAGRRRANLALRQPALLRQDGRQCPRPRRLPEAAWRVHREPRVRPRRRAPPRARRVLPPVQLRKGQAGLRRGLGKDCRGRAGIGRRFA